VSSHVDHWQPLIGREMLLKRSRFFQQVRDFFASCQVLEVDTPVLSTVTATDPYLDSYEVINPSAPGQPLYLLTSPEHAMKRLIADGSGAIFQITKALRRDEAGSRHNPEFAMLEWYRPGFTLMELQAEVEALLRYMGYPGQIHSLSYREAFKSACALDPFDAVESELFYQAEKVSRLPAADMSLDTALDVLMSHQVEPSLKALGAVFVYDYPASQAALAKVARDKDGTLVAKRFELYINGIEVANAYDELSDPVEQQARFEVDNAVRRALGKGVIPIDQRLIQALPTMPDTSGIALGLDRLLMVLEGKTSIQEVLAFPKAFI